MSFTHPIVAQIIDQADKFGFHLLLRITKMINTSRTSDSACSHVVDILSSRQAIARQTKFVSIAVDVRSQKIDSI